MTTNVAPSKLRILLVTDACAEGVARHVADLANGLLRRGHDVDVWHGTREVSEQFAADVASLRDRGVGVWTFHTTRAPRAADAALVATMRARLTRGRRYDVLHGHSSKGGALLRLAAGAELGVRVYTAHSFFTMNPALPATDRFVYSAIELALALRADRILCNSEQERRHARELGISPSLLEVVPNGCRPLEPLPRAEARRVLGLPRDGEVIGFVGRLAPQKDPELALRAFECVQRQRRGATLCIVGDGELEATLRRTAGPNVVFARAGDAAPLMSAFDVFLLSSRYESFGYVLVEAARSGVPIVSTPVGVAEEIVGDGLAGVLSAPNAEAMGRGCLALLEDDVWRRACGAEARRRADAYSVDAMVERSVDAYRRAASSRPQAADRLVGMASALRSMADLARTLRSERA